MKPDFKLDEMDRVLIVEGYSDLTFFSEFLATLHGPDKVFIKPMEGKTDLIAKLETFISAKLLADKKTICVIVDADDNPRGTKESLENELSRITGQQVTNESWTKGNPSIGLYVTPGGGANGEIETLVWNAWSREVKNHPARDCIMAYRDCMGGTGIRARSPEKGLLSSLFAIKNDDDPRLGPSARAGEIDLGSGVLDPLRDFLRSC